MDIQKNWKQTYTQSNSRQLYRAGVPIKILTIFSKNPKYIKNLQEFHKNINFLFVLTL